MLTSKQRANLRSLAAVMKPIGQVGKDGITENLVAGISDALEARELVKLTLLHATGEDALELAESLAEALHAELVAVTGKKAVFYRRSSRKDFEHLAF